MTSKYKTYERPDFIVQVEKKLLPYGSANRTGETQNPIYIVIHEVSLGTGKSPKNFNMEHYKNKIEQDGLNGSPLGYHYLVGDEEIYQFIEDYERTNHTGTYEGNECSIGVERLICEGINYEHALHNQAKLIATLMVKWNIPIENVVTHKKMQEIFKPKIIKYKLQTNIDGSGEVVIDFETYIEELKETQAMLEELTIDEQKQYQIELRSLFVPEETFNNYQIRERQEQLLRVVTLQCELKKLQAKSNNIEYKPICKIYDGLGIIEVLERKPCPSRLIAGQNGGLPRFYSEIRYCLENNLFFNEVLEDKKDIKTLTA